MYERIYARIYAKIIMKKYTHKLTKTSSHSYFIIIPKEIINKYGWKEKQKITITDKGRGKIVIRDWKKR